MGDLADPLATRRVDPDLRPDVPLRVEREHDHLAERATDLQQLVQAQPGLVVVRQHHDVGLQAGHRGCQRTGHLPLPVEHALGGLVAAVDALAGHPVVLRRVPGHQGLPDVVVREVPVLVVGRVQVGEVEGAQRRGQGHGVASHRRSGPRQEVGHPEVEVPEGPGGPRLQVRHLLPGGRVDPVGCLDEAGQQDREQR